MKKIFKFSFILILGTGILSSCAKKADNTPAPAAPSSSMSATLDGTAWTASSVNTVNNSGTLGIVGSGSNSASIEIELPANATAGTDSVSAATTGTYGILYSSGSSSYYISKGAIVITSNASNTVSGTFSGTLTDLMGSGNPITVTKGAFTAKY